MEKSFAFNSINKDRVYKAEDFASYFASFIGNGIFPNPASQLQVVDNNDMTVTVKEGRAWINGYYYQNTNDFILKLDPADSVLNRIDRVVLRLDFNKRAINLTIKKGEFSSNAEAKKLQRDADAYEIALADIKIDAGAISITQANITDLRLNKNLCGIVHGVVDQVDTTAIFNQFESWYSTTKTNYDKDISIWTKEKKQAFEEWYSKNTQQFSQDFQEWFETLKDKLDGDVAAKLQKQIDTLKKDVEDYANKIGDIKDLKTTNKDNLVDVLNEVFTNVDNGKNNLYTAITDKKITPKSKDFADLVEGIKDIKLGQGNAQVSEVLVGKTFTNDSGIIQTGTMPNMGSREIEPKNYVQELGKGYYNNVKVKGINDLDNDSMKEVVKTIAPKIKDDLPDLLQSIGMTPFKIWKWTGDCIHGAYESEHETTPYSIKTVPFDFKILIINHTGFHRHDKGEISQIYFSKELITDKLTDDFNPDICAFKYLKDSSGYIYHSFTPSSKGDYDIPEFRLEDNNKIRFPNSNATNITIYAIGW